MFFVSTMAPQSDRPIHTEIAVSVKRRFSFSADLGSVIILATITAEVFAEIAIMIKMHLQLCCNDYNSNTLKSNERLHTCNIHVYKRG